MKLEYGEYVKFQNGYIGKVENINDFREPSMKYAIDIQKYDLVFVGEDYIVKNRKDIIDLIEKNDYVNGVRILDITGDYIHTAEWDCCKERLRKKLQSIITKEQIKQIEFRIKE
jgi:hypothetical protein